MKRALAAVILLLLSVGRCPAGAGFGVRAGWSDLTGDVFRGSGNLGNVHLFGLHAVLPLASMFDLGLAGEGKNDRFTFDRAGVEGSLFKGRGEWRDLALYVSLHLHVIPIGAGPLRLYAGGGGGVHFTEMTIKDPVPMTAGPAMLRGARTLEDPVDDFIRRVEEERTDFSWHALAGASLGLPVLPLSVFAETRFEDVGGSFRPKGYSLYGGLNLELP